MLDKVFLSIAARGTARWFLERTAEVVSAPEPVVDLPALAPSRTDVSSRSG